MKKHCLALCALLLLPTPINASEPVVLINEIAWMGTTTSSNDEWLELYNPTKTDVDLTGWRLEAIDGSPKINLAGTLKAGEYFLLERTDDESVPDIAADQIYSGALSNSSEYLKLFDAAGNLVDEINATEGWPGGDNTTKQTLQRLNDSWQTSAEPGGSPKAQNIDNPRLPSEEPTTQTTPEDNSEPEEQTPTEPAVKKGDIIINEIFPNPLGPDDNQKNPEFIELKNVSSQTIDLTGWRLKTSNKQEYILSSLTINPGIIVVFDRTKTKLNLNNTKEKITLYNKANKIIDQSSYSKAAEENQSYQKDEAGNWLWGETSPGQENTAKETIYPEIFISGPDKTNVGQIVEFDGSDSFDPKNRTLNFSWDFGDGRTAQGPWARQIYTQAGKYEVSLTVTADETTSSTEKIKITVAGENQNNNLSNTSTPTSTEPLAENQTLITENIPFVFIAEFFPSPEGSDLEAEFIELFNQEPTSVNLAGWQLDDAEGGSKPYTFPPGTIIKPGQYLAFWRPETKIALNNSDEAIRLFNPAKTMVDYVEFEESKEGISFVLDENFNWQQTDTPTPGEINVLNQIESTSTDATADKEETKKPAVLGISPQEIEPEKSTDKTKRYWFSGISALVILGIGTVLKLKKRNQ